ncbi:hypothetical protein [Scytonema sp. NUACC26]|uniref:hypothetical protein n=1 Tax=Scytonema sp. NUACC26 TaxID=3140176 RepID=UPI0034DCA079
MIPNFQLLKRTYNAFDPFRPLPAGDPTYVDCREVRGDGDILVEVGREILMSDRMTCQLCFFTTSVWSQVFYSSGSRFL